MQPDQLRILLEQVRDGSVSPEDAERRMQHMPFEDLGYAKVDHHRAIRHGMPEVILGRFLGLRCAAISTITNMAAGMSDEKISHSHTKAMAPLGAAKLETVLRRFLSDL